MDQLKPILAQIKKHHFWILCGVVAILCVVFGYLGTTDLSNKWHARASEIQSAMSTGRQIASISNHPNDRVAEQMQAVNRAQAEQVYAAWRERFMRQKEILVWPKELRQDFIAKVEPLHPIESAVPFPEPPGFVLKRNDRARYMNYIQNELPKLAEIIKAKWAGGGQTSNSEEGGGYADGGGNEPTGGGGFNFGAGAGDPDGGGGGATEAEEESPWVVDWDASNQSELASRFDWSSNPDGVPSVLQILYAQEDLWVLKSLMEIVRRTNGDADAQYNAAVKAIKDIRLGASAGGIKDGGQVKLLESTSSQSSSSGYGAMMGGASGGASSSGSTSGAAGYGAMMSGTTAATGPDPADNRYVDDKYAPVKGSQLRAAFKSTNPGDAFLVVAKRMPVRLRLEVDVLKLPRLLAECGNAKLTYEIRQVRINPQSEAAGGGGLDSGGGFAGGGRGPSGMGSGMGGGAPGGMSPDLGGDGPSGNQGSDDAGYGGLGGAAGGGAGEAPESPYKAEVEVYGLIYLYNPPQRTKLGLPEEEEQPADAQANNQAGGGPPAAGG